MVHYLLTLFSSLFFAICCHFLIRAITAPIPLMVIHREYTITALKIEKGFKILSWGLLTVVLFASLVNSFLQVFSEL